MTKPLLQGRARVQRCEQCGREGVRGFKTMPATEVTVEGERYTIGPYTFCASVNACRKRWPRHPEVEV